MDLKRPEPVPLVGVSWQAGRDEHAVKPPEVDADGTLPLARAVPGRATRSLVLVAILAATLAACGDRDGSTPGSCRPIGNHGGGSRTGTGASNRRRPTADHHSNPDSRTCNHARFHRTEVHIGRKRRSRPTLRRTTNGGTGARTGHRHRHLPGRRVDGWVEGAAPGSAAAGGVNRPGFPGDSISWEIMEYGKTDYVFTGGAGACCSDGVRASGRTSGCTAPARSGASYSVKA